MILVGLYFSDFYVTLDELKVPENYPNKEIYVNVTVICRGQPCKVKSINGNIVKLCLFTNNQDEHIKL